MEEFFDLYENTENSKILINKNVTMIHTCNINKVKDMSPDFINDSDQYTFLLFLNL